MDHGISPHHQPDGIVFWMAADSGAPVRVFITKEALHTELDSCASPVDQASGMMIFEKHRDRIEEAAGRKFDAEGIAGVLDGKPTLIVDVAAL
jgi:hypothetical protein